MDGIEERTANLAFKPKMKNNKQTNPKVTLKSVVKSLNDSKWKDPKTWPVSLHNFIGRSFETASKKQFNDNELSQFKNQLKNLINLAITGNKILENDWDKQELPILTGAGYKKLGLYCDEQNSKEQTQSERESKSNNEKKNRRNIFGEEETDSDDSNTSNSSNDDSQNTEPSSKPAIFFSESLKRLKKQKRDPQLPVKPPIVPLIDDDEIKKNLRSKRFERELSTPLSYKDSPISTDPIIGRNENLEKKYLRLTSQPNPDTIRPLRVLHKTLQLLFDKYTNGATYNYLCDQCKSLRQDLTVQNIKHDFTIMAYELHSKIAIEYGDWGEFNQCQSQLKILYNIKELNKPNYFEFLGYRILYYILTGNINEVYELESILIKDGIIDTDNEFFKYSLSIFQYISVGDYYSLSQTVNEIYRKNRDKEALLMNKEARLLINDENALLLNHNKFYYFTKFIEQILERENMRTLLTLCCGYRQLSVSFVKELLCMENEEEKFEQFIKENNLSTFINETNTIFNCHQAKLTVENVKNKLYKIIDIKGQV